MINISQHSDLANQMLETFDSTSESVKKFLPKQSAQVDDIHLDVAGTLTAFPKSLNANVIDDSGNSRPIIIKDDDIFDQTIIAKNFAANIASKKLKGYFDSQQKWEGRVEVLKNESFVATVVDLTNPNLNDGEVEIELDEITEDDRELVREGAIFYWNLGQYHGPDGTIYSSSMVKFRRLPSPGKRYQHRIAKMAQTYFK